MHKHFLEEYLNNIRAYCSSGIDINPSLIQPRGQYIELLRNKGVLYDSPFFNRNLKTVLVFDANGFIN